MARSHVQIVFRPMMVQSCRAQLPCILAAYSIHQDAKDASWLQGSTHCSPGRHFFGSRQLSFGRAPVPGRLAACALASCTTKLNHADVEVRFLRVNLVSCWTRWRSLLVAIRSASGKKIASMALPGLSSADVLVEPRFAVSRSKWARVKAADVMNAYLMPIWSKCECCYCGGYVYTYVQLIPTRSTSPLWLVHS